MAAESIRIEIPVTVQDNTGPAVASITRGLNNIATSAKKISKLLNPTMKTSGLEKEISGIERKIDSVSNHKIEIGAHDDATHTIASVEDAASRASNITATMEIGAEDNATGIINDVGDSASTLNGNESNIELGANDDATGTINDVGDAASTLNGNESNVEIGAEDNATNVIADVGDALSSLNGQSATIEINTEDNTGFFADSGGGGSGGTISGSALIDGVAGGVFAKASGAMMTVAGISGLSLGVASAIQTFGDFESEMSHVKAISGATEEEFASLSDKAKELGATTKFTATESAQAFGYMAMAGWKPEQMEAGIDGVINLAAASGESIASVSDIVTDAMTAFGLSADKSTHFADVLAQSAASSNTNVGMLGESFKYIAPLAGAMGYSIEDVGIALGLMANAGVKGSMAGTSLRTAISNLAAPTDQMLTAMEKYGISLTDEEGNMKSLAGVMENTRESLRGLSEDEQAAAVETIFGKNAMSGMLAIINATDEDYQNLTNSINSADGAAGRMADTMMDNMQGALTLLASQWDQVQNSFGSRLAPYITAGANALKEALPGVEEKINEIFDGVDHRITTMTSSKEWTEADFFGKVDIAWDTLIADPFNEWIDSEGYTMIGGAFSKLFSKAANVFTGDGTLTDWASLGLVAIGFQKLAGGIGAISSAIEAFPGVGALEGLTGMTGMIGPAVVAAGGVALAVWSIKQAVDSYNQLQINNNLADHFGDLQLSAEEAQALAEQVVPVSDITLSLEEANVHFHSAATARQKAIEELKSINNLQWKLQNIELDASEAEIETDLETLKTKAEGLRDTIVEAISEDKEGSTGFIESVLGGTNLSGLIASWFDEDTQQVEAISGKITEMLQRSIEAGAEDVETAAAVSILQTKMMEIMTGARKAELQGKLDWLSMTTSGSALNADSWKMTVEDIGSVVNEFMQADREGYENFFGSLAQLEYNDPSRHAEIEAIRQTVMQANARLQNESVLSGWSWMYGSLSDEVNGYGSEMGTARDILKGYNFDAWNYMTGIYGAVQDIGNALPEGAQGALADRYEAMFPTVEAIQSIIDEAGRKGEAVPQAIMDAYNQAIELGVMSGGDKADYGAYFGSLMAQQFATLEDFEAYLAQNNSSMDQYEEGVQEAIRRAFVPTTDDPDYAGITDSLIELLGEQEIDWGKVRDLVAEAGYDITDGLKEQGIDVGDTEVPVEGNVTPDLSGISMQQSFSNIGDERVSPNMEGVYKGGGVTEGYAYGRGVGQTVETEVTVNTIATPGETDTSEVAAAVEEDVQGAIESDPVESDGEASIELTQTNNADEVRSGVKSDLDKALTDIPVSATANVSVTWTLANGTNSLNSSEGASVPISVALAHSATGRFVDSPLLSLIGEDGPEYVIPVGADKHRRGLDLWMQAGEDLGVQGFADGYSPSPVSTSSAPVPVSIGGGTNNNNANVKFNPRINVNGMDGATLQAAMNKKMQEYADSMAGELADMLAETYENRPVA